MHVLKLGEIFVLLNYRVEVLSNQSNKNECTIELLVSFDLESVVDSDAPEWRNNSTALAHVFGSLLHSPTIKICSMRPLEDIMSVLDIERPPCSLVPGPILRKRVSFCADHPVTEVVEVNHEYPPDYFYTRFDMKR